MRFSRAGFRRAALAAACLVLVPFLGFTALDALSPFPVERLNPDPATVVEARDGARLRIFLPGDDALRMPVGLNEVPDILVETLIGSEDQRFFLHPGVDILAALRAAWSNVRAGRVVSGASTIPMQIARMADPRPRSLWAKAVESFRALQLEGLYSKDELLEIYLNMLPMGGNAVGVGAGAWRLFGKPVEEVSLAEAALMTALPRSPAACDPFRDPARALALRNRVLDQLAERGITDRDKAREAKTRPLPAKPGISPLKAPHFCLLAAREAGYPARVRTSLDPAMQARVERVLALHAPLLRARGVGNAACVVLDVKTREVLAMAGSVDFSDASRAGQVNMALAPRSPGSALKPFLYALAMDKGLIVPGALVSDLPVDFAGYGPENYDGTYSGLVTAREALARSLNVPAVRLLARTGLGDFYDLLKRGGLATLDRPPRAYGLPLVLGACEVTLADLTNLYATLVDHGRHKPWRVTPMERKEETNQGLRLFSPEAAWLTTDILMDVARPDLPGSWDLTLGAPAMAWKTGTSFGHRDAWAVGADANLAVGVWVGNPDGSPVLGISGARDAGPLLFEAVRAVSARPAPPVRPGNLDLETMEVCAPDRLPPAPLCPERTRITVISGRTRLPRSTAYKRVFVDDETGLKLAGSCLESRPHHAEIFEVPPPELAAWRASLGMADTGAAEPALHPECRDADLSAEGRGERVRIISPSPDTPYRIRRDAPAAFQRIALKAAGPGNAPLHWYGDGRYLGKSRPETPLFLTPRPGRHRVAAMDDSGAMDQVEFTVIGGARTGE